MLSTAHAAEPATADTGLPLWEAGAGIASLYGPQYRGSDQNRGYILPVPYLIYRGEKVKFDRDGLRASIFDINRVTLDFSGAGAFPVRSKDTRAREGMNNLGGAIELGPSLNYRAFESKNKDVVVDLRMPFRAAIAIGGSESIRYTGILITPRINVDLKNIAGLPGVEVGTYLGPVFADRRNNAYFYSVAPQYALADRPAYDAKGGFGGWQWAMSATKRMGNMWIGAFVRVDSLKNAVYEDSPLVKKTTYFYGGFAVSWIFKTSDERVK